MDRPELVGVTILNGDPPSLETVQKLVGGYVQMIIISDDRQMLVDEDGLAKKLPVNPIATQMAGTCIVGHAVVLGGSAKWT